MSSHHHIRQRVANGTLYEDPSVFEELDNDVIKVAEQEQSSFTELVRQLTAHCITDLQKARYLYIALIITVQCLYDEMLKHTFLN